MRRAALHASKVDVRNAKEYFMLDVLMLSLGLGLFVLGIGYAYACEWL
jgi:hypothetical protein